MGLIILWAGEIMNVAVVTGASSGLGVEYVKQIAKMYPTLDEIWLVERRQEKLVRDFALVE